MMNHYFYNGRQVGAAITLAGAQGTIHAVNQTIQMQTTSIFCTNDAKVSICPIHNFRCKLYITMYIQLVYFPFHMAGHIYEKESDSIESLFIFRLASFQGRRRGYHYK